MAYDRRPGLSFVVYGRFFLPEHSSKRGGVKREKKKKPAADPQVIRDDCLLQTEVTLRIVVADTLNDLFQDCVVIREFPVFHPFSDLIAENTAEIFMPCIAEEAAAVGKHADEVAQ